MTPDRPPRAAVRAAVRACLADLEPGQRILVGLSGGPDSLALVAAAVRISAELGLECGAVVIDHQLQPGSAQVAARAAEQARILGARASVRAVEVARGPGTGGREAAAREARYAALAACAAEPGTGGQPAAAVLLGHTRDDQAETVLLGLARGSGTRSVAGMAARSGCYRRPLLDLPRQVVARAAADEASADPRIAPWTDPHNADRAFARVRLRDQALPALVEALGPGVSGSLARTARLARQDADALDAWADQAWAALRGAPGAHGEAQIMVGDADGRVARLTVAGVRGGDLPEAIVTRVLRRFLIAAGCPASSLTAEHVWAVADLLPGPPGRSEVALPAGRRARRDGCALVVRA